MTTGGNEDDTMGDSPVSMRYFVVGVILLIFAMALAIWGFGIGRLTPDQRFILLWALPLASGFAAGSFTGAIKTEGKRLIPGLAIVATGGFAVWLLSYFLLPKGPPVNTFGTVSEMEKVEQKAPQLTIADMATDVELKQTPAVPAEKVRLHLYNQTTEDLYVLIYNCTPAPAGLPACKFDSKAISQGSNAYYEKFRPKSCGWYVFYVCTPQLTYHRLGRRNIFGDEHPTMTIVASGNSFAISDL
jgi:hypothetical protein